MKAKFLGLLAVVLFSFSWVVSAQIAGSLSSSQPVKVQLTTDYKQYLAQEPIYITVRVINYSGQTLRLADDPEWITFSVEPVSRKGTIRQNGPLEVPPISEAKKNLESGMMVNVPINLVPQYDFVNPGPYKIVAKFKAGQLGEFKSEPYYVDIVSGNTLWEQEFGVPGKDDKSLDLRKYRIIQSRNLDVSLLFIKVTDTYDTTVYGINALGKLIYQSASEQMTDKNNRLHILHQSGSKAFTYTMVGYDGKILLRMIYEYSATRPRLRLSESGDVVVAGGIRVKKPYDIDPLADVPPNKIEESQ